MKPASLKTALLASLATVSLTACGAEGDDQVWTVVDTIPIVALNGTTSASGEVHGSMFYVYGRMSTHVDYLYATAEPDGSIVQHLTSELKDNCFGGRDRCAVGDDNVDVSKVKIFQDATTSTARIDVKDCHAKPGTSDFGCADLEQRLEIHVPPGSFTTDFDANAG